MSEKALLSENHAQTSQVNSKSSQTETEVFAVYGAEPEVQAYVARGEETVCAPNFVHLGKTTCGYRQAGSNGVSVTFDAFEFETHPVSG